jgi:hypothetical protein
MTQSLAARDKLQAILNHDWHDANRNFAQVYVEACATWFAGLSDRERKVADLALRAYQGGHPGSAEKIAANLPPAPKFPTVSR